MGEALDWFRANVCDAEDHDHGPDGELACLLESSARISRRGDDVDDG